MGQKTALRGDFREGVRSPGEHQTIYSWWGGISNYQDGVKGHHTLGITWGGDPRRKTDLINLRVFFSLLLFQH